MMTKEIKQDVSGTAFVVNYSRSKMVNISRDTYANFWVTDEAISLWNDLAEHVYPYDDLNLSLRNRFYLDLLERFIGENENPVFINIAAGLTNYPFLVEGNCTFVEIDLPNITEFKKRTVTQWMDEKKLPHRIIEFIAADLNDDKLRTKMKETLSRIIGNRPSLVVMEGLTYYLAQETLSDIFRILSDIQAVGSLVAFDYWKPDTLEYPAMMRLKEYLNTKFGSQSGEWNLFDREYIEGIQGFTEVLSTDIAQLELQYAETRLFQGRENKIPDNFAVLKKT